MPIDANKLKGKVVERGLSGSEVATALGISQSTYYRKISKGGTSFTVAQVRKIAEVLNLSSEECNAIFFSA